MIDNVQRAVAMKMTERRYTVCFLTPAFLGDAEQKGRWRTPPFKHLLREWWRVAYAAEKNFKVDLEAMRREEGLLFGHAWLEDDYYMKNDRREKTTARKSRIRLRLDSDVVEPAKVWDRGTQRGVQPLSKGLETSYAWFGLVDRGAGLPDRTALKADAVEGRRQIYLAYPDDPSLDRRMTEVVRLIAAFGLLGSRSRGGWGSLDVEGVEPLEERELKRYARPLNECLESDWAMSIAKDREGLCVWTSENRIFSAWHEVMREIAKLRREVRQKLKNVQGKDLRPALGFAGEGRMPSPLRWKVLPQNDRFAFRVFALPHRLPDASRKCMSPDDLLKAWQEVCRTLDSSNAVERVR
jgi:CRISPR-associated protein Cmr1